MAEYLDCAPCYEGRPDYDPTLGDAELFEPTVDTVEIFADTDRKTADETPTGAGRSRYDSTLGAKMNLTVDTTMYTVDSTKLTADQTLIAIAGLFARSKLSWFGDTDFQGQICNAISLEVIGLDTNNPPDGIINQYDLIVYFQSEEVERFSTAAGSNAITDLRSQINASSNYISMPERGYDIYDSGTDTVSLSPYALTALTGATGPGAGNIVDIRTGPHRSLLNTATKEEDDGSPISTDAIIQWNYDIEYWVPYVLDADCAIPSERCP